MTNHEETILVFGISEPTESPSEVRRGIGGLVRGAAGRVAVSTLQENMRRFLSQVDGIMTFSPKEIGGLTLDEIEIHAQIDGKGNVGLAGIGGAELALQGGIKFVLRKKG